MAEYTPTRCLQCFGTGSLYYATVVPATGLMERTDHVVCPWCQGTGEYPPPQPQKEEP